MIKVAKCFEIGRDFDMRVIEFLLATCHSNLIKSVSHGFGGSFVSLSLVYYSISSGADIQGISMEVTRITFL